MKYIKPDKKIMLDKHESNIITTATMELGGYFNSPFSKHLYKFYIDKYDDIAKILNAYNEIKLNDIHLVIDLLQACIIESKGSIQWSDYDPEMKTEDLKDVLNDLIKIYSENVTEY